MGWGGRLPAVCSPSTMLLSLFAYAKSPSGSKRVVTTIIQTSKLFSRAYFPDFRCNLDTAMLRNLFRLHAQGGPDGIQHRELGIRQTLELGGFCQLLDGLHGRLVRQHPAAGMHPERTFGLDILVHLHRLVRVPASHRIANQLECVTSAPLRIDVCTY